MSSRHIRGNLVYKSTYVKTTAGAINAADIANASLVVVNKTSGGATAVTLPAAQYVGQAWKFVDAKGDAAVNPITITPASGLINGASTYVINENYGSVEIVWDGTNYTTDMIARPQSAIRFTDKFIGSAQVLALNATPQTLVAAPGAGKFLEFLGAYLFLDYATTAYNGIAAGEDLVVKYTNAAGAAVSTQVETTGFLDQTSDQLRVARPVGTDPAVLALASNAALVLHLLVGEVTTGDSPLKVRTFYRVIEQASLEAIA
jgi:hypothetical protein